jgi:flagellar biosynthesis/type III secretory pathway protein FliH
MPREFKPVRFFVMMGIAAFVVCGVTVFYTHRAEHGRTAEERAAYWIGEKAGEQAPRDAKLPSPAELNMMAQKCFEQQGSGNKQDCNLAFEKGYEDGFKKTHPER